MAGRSSVLKGGAGGLTAGVGGLAAGLKRGADHLLGVGVLTSIPPHPGG
jgi:hypothetical protein